VEPHPHGLDVLLDDAPVAEPGRLGHRRPLVDHAPAVGGDDHAQLGIARTR
jgi:hypothetical protein